MKKERRKGPPGAPRKYPIADLEVGETVLLAFHRVDGGAPDIKRNGSMNSAIQSYGRRSGKTFKREVEGATGIRVTRLS